MIVVRLEGGLGNQLFQYSYGVALQARHGGRLVLDNRLIRGDPSKANALGQVADIDRAHIADEMLVFLLRVYAAAGIRMVGSRRGCENTAAQFLTRFGIHHPYTTRYQALDVAPLPFIYLNGNFMSEKYFASAVGRVRSLIHLENVLTPISRGFVSQLEALNSVAVHIRRGDYLHDRWRDRLHVCSEDYYERAVALVQEKVDHPVFYVFSNSIEDTQWVRDNYRFWPAGTVFVPPGESDVEHFALMAACRHFILANSTFSWWASYLSANKDKVIVAPSPWNRNAWDMSDLYCPGWMVVDLDLDAAAKEPRNSTSRVVS